MQMALWIIISTLLLNWFYPPVCVYRLPCQALLQERNLICIYWEDNKNQCMEVKCKLVVSYFPLTCVVEN